MRSWEKGAARVWPAKVVRWRVELSMRARVEEESEAIAGRAPVSALASHWRTVWSDPEAMTRHEGILRATAPERAMALTEGLASETAIAPEKWRLAESRVSWVGESASVVE